MSVRDVSGQLSVGSSSNHSMTNNTSNTGDEANTARKISHQTLVSVLNDPTAQRSQTDYIFIKDWGSYFVEQPTICSNILLDEERMKALKRCALKRTKILKRFEEQNRIKSKMRDTRTLNENLQKIPSPFLNPDFDVQQRETLLFILGHRKSNDSKMVTDISPMSVRKSQQVLSDLLDVVEDHLSNQISARIRDFFQIMSAMDLVMDQVSRTIREVTSVRRKCILLKQSLIKPCVQTILLTRIRYNSSELLKKLSIMEALHQSSNKVNILLSSKDYVRALFLIRDSRKMVKEQLLGVKCCQNLDLELQERERLIDKNLARILQKGRRKERNEEVDRCPMH